MTKTTAVEAFGEAVAAVVAEADAVAVVVAIDIAAHLGGIADRLTVNWQWRLIGLLCVPYFICW